MATNFSKNLAIWDKDKLNKLVFGYILVNVTDIKSIPIEIKKLILAFFCIDVKWHKIHKSDNIDIIDDYTIKSKAGWGIAIVDCILTYNFKFIIKITDDSKEHYIRFLIGFFHSNQFGDLSEIHNFDGYFGPQGGNKCNTSMGLFFYTHNPNMRGFGGRYGEEQILFQFPMQKPKINDTYELYFNFTAQKVTFYKNGIEIGDVFAKEDMPKCLIPAVAVTGREYSLSIEQGS